MKLTKADLVAIEEGNSDYILEKGASLYSEEEYEKAIEYYRLASSMGSAQATCNLGYCYMYARSIPKNMDLALAYFKMAAKFDVIDALYKLGELYKNGNGVEKDEETSMYYYNKAFDVLFKQYDDELDAAYAYPSLFYTKAKMLKDGEFICQDLRTSFRFLILAIQGYSYQIENNGCMYYENALNSAIELVNDPIYDEVKDEIEEEIELENEEVENEE